MTKRNPLWAGAALILALDVCFRCKPSVIFQDHPEVIALSELLNRLPIHRAPLSQLREGQKTTLRDLALVCSNCHRKLHRGAERLTMERLRRVLSS